MSLVMVTGGAGFIGRELCHQLFERGHHIIVVEKETYAARPDLLYAYRDRLRVERRDVADLDSTFGVEVVFHLAAETHVDNSITDARRFLDSNIAGTYGLLELIHGQRPHDRPLLIHVSTDEVYGDFLHGESYEHDRLIPSSPYAATKAAADMLVMAWDRTYGVRSRIVRPSNCYGCDQYPEKLIPKTVRHWQTRRPMTVHGDGLQTRSWLSVEDCARALLTVWERGQDGSIYNIPGNAEVCVRDVVRRIQAVCQARDPLPEYQTGQEVLEGCDRPGGDLRYCVNGERLLSLGWLPNGRFWHDLPRIVRHELESGVRI